MKTYSPTKSVIPRPGHFMLACFQSQCVWFIKKNWENGRESKYYRKKFLRCSYPRLESIQQPPSLRVRRALCAPGAPLLHLRAVCWSRVSLLLISKLSPSTERLQNRQNRWKWEEDAGFWSKRKKRKVNLIGSKRSAVSLRPSSRWTRSAESGTRVQARREEELRQATKREAGQEYLDFTFKIKQRLSGSESEFCMMVVTFT